MIVCPYSAALVIVVVDERHTEIPRLGEVMCDVGLSGSCSDGISTTVDFKTDHKAVETQAISRRVTCA